MKFFLFLVVAFVGTADLAQAGNGDIGSVSKAQVRCEGAGGGFAFALPKGDDPSLKVWTTEKGMDEGLELTVTSYRPFRCPDCFEISATTTFFNSVIEYSFQLTTLPGDPTPILVASVKSGNEEMPLPRLSCVKQ